MELSDNPHPVGTTEHHRWIVDEYIPALTEDQKEQHRKRAGAEAIGAQLIDESRRFTFRFDDIDLSELVKDYSVELNTDSILRAEQWQRAFLDEWKPSSKTIKEILRGGGLT